jgi:magnesium transporter
VGEQKVAAVTIHRTDYSATMEPATVVTKDVADLANAFEPDTVTWIDVDGLHNADLIGAVGKIFGIHPLLIEDILHTDQRPKVEQYPDYIFIVMQLLHWVDNQVEFEQLSLILGDSFVLTFQETNEDPFGPIRQRLQDPPGRLRRSGADYLAYSLLDVVVDNYFLILEELGEKIEALENRLVRDPSEDLLEPIYRLKREMLHLRRSVWPLREVVAGLQRGESSHFEESTLVYLRDVYDHIIQVIDTVETYRDIASSLIDIYLTGVSNRMNEVMKVLTVISTIFIPLTFITGLYGMNFAYMPELGWRWGYPVVWGIIVLISVVMLIYFRRRDWL